MLTSNARCALKDVIVALMQKLASSAKKDMKFKVIPFTTSLKLNLRTTHIASLNVMLQATITTAAEIVLGALVMST